MTNFRRAVLSLFAVVVLLFPFEAFAQESGADLSRRADAALNLLIRSNPAAARVAQEAKQVLVFPRIVKAGLVIGGAYGEGVLKRGSVVVGYFSSVTASFGLQAGAQTYGYALFLMSDEAVNYLNETSGWEIGTGPSVALVNEGVAKNLTTTTLSEDVYAFVFDQQGLMATLSLEGTKISRIEKP